MGALIAAIPTDLVARHCGPRFSGFDHSLLSPDFGAINLPRAVAKRQGIALDKRVDEIGKRLACDI
jgi:hypothetical protein